MYTSLQFVESVIIDSKSYRNIYRNKYFLGLRRNEGSNPSKFVGILWLKIPPRLYYSFHSYQDESRRAGWNKDITKRVKERRLRHKIQRISVQDDTGLITYDWID